MLYVPPNKLANVLPGKLLAPPEQAACAGLALISVKVPVATIAEAPSLIALCSEAEIFTVVDMVLRRNQNLGGIRS
jgi:hypothetical protein